MLDAEIYVDRIADMRVNDMNAVLEAVRQMASVSYTHLDGYKRQVSLPLQNGSVILRVSICSAILETEQ